MQFIFIAIRHGLNNFYCINKLLKKNYNAYGIFLSKFDRNKAKEFKIKTIRLSTATKTGKIK